MRKNKTREGERKRKEELETKRKGGMEGGRRLREDSKEKKTCLRESWREGRGKSSGRQDLREGDNEGEEKNSDKEKK